MGYPIIVSPAISDAGTITGAATPSSMGVANLLKRQPTDICRFSSLSGMYFELSLPRAWRMSYFFLGYSNATSSATIRWRGASSQAGLIASPTYDSGDVSFWPSPADVTELESWPKTHHFHNELLSEEMYECSWWRADINDSSNPAGYFQAGRLIMAPWGGGGTLAPLATDGSARPYLWRASNGAAKDGIEVGNVSEIRRTKSEGGQTFARARPSGRILSVPMVGIEKDEAYKFCDAIGRLRGISREVLLVINPDDTEYLHQQSAYGLLSEPVRQTVIGVDPPLWQVTLRIEEMT